MRHDLWQPSKRAGPRTAQSPTGSRFELRGYQKQTATFERKTDAKRWAQQTEAAIREGRHFKTAEARRHTLGELLGRYRRDVFAKHPKKLRDQSQHVTWWEDH